MNSGSVQDQLLAGQRAYYSALAPDYLDQGLDLPGGAELTDALDAFGPAGSVPELACGPGTWTRLLLRHASDVTAVDASPEMLAIAASRLPGGGPGEIRPGRLVHPGTGPRVRRRLHGVLAVARARRAIRVLLGAGGRRPRAARTGVLRR